MTLIEAVQDIFEGLGEPSDLRYGPRGDTLSVGSTPSTALELAHWARLVEVVNRAQNRIASWKFPNGRQLRFRESAAKTLFKTIVRTETNLDGVIGEYEVSGTIVGTYNADESWVLDINGELFQIVYATGIVLGLDRPLTSTFVGLTGYLRRRKYYWSASAIPTPGVVAYGVGGGLPASVHALESDSGSQIEFVSQLPFTLSVAEPTQAYCTSNSIEFVEAPDTVQTILVSYSRGPIQMVVGQPTQELWLPPQYHEAVVLYGLWWGYRRAQENSSAYSTKRDLDDFLARVRSESDYQDEFRTVQMTYTME